MRSDAQDGQEQVVGLLNDALGEWFTVPQPRSENTIARRVNELCRALWTHPAARNSDGQNMLREEAEARVPPELHQAILRARR